jgi:glycosyltransferase involved in cell wall biosynthesis
VVSMGAFGDRREYVAHSNITLRSMDIAPSTISKKISNATKLMYLMKVPLVRREIRLFKPDIVHAHFASSYGLLGSLSNFHPLILSVWGTDVFEFPEISPLHRALLRFNLSKADRVLSTSCIMARQTSKFTRKPIEVTPFGVDIRQLRPRKREMRSGVTIGTVKALERQYGIDYLLRAFTILSQRNPLLTLNLLIVGGGSQRGPLESLAGRLGVKEKVTFTGNVPHGEIERWHNMIDISVFPSLSESFGVAAVEASACGNPVVASDVGGLPEVVEHGVTGFIVPPRDPYNTANAIEKLVLDSSLRAHMGSAGRDRIERLFNWDDNIRQMVEIYDSTLHGH